MPEKLLQYDVVEILGEGAKSTIYAVVDPVTGRQFALKHVIRKNPKDLRLSSRSKQSSRSAGSLTTPTSKSYELKTNKKYFVQVTEAFLLMEYFKGRSL